MPTIKVLDSTGTPQDVQLPNANGRATAALSRPVALSVEDLAALTAIGTQPLPAGGNVIGGVGIVGTVSVSGSFYPATQPVSGPLTDAQMRAAAVPVSLAAQPLPTGAATEATLVKIDQTTPWTDKSATLTGSAQTLFASVTAGSIQERFIANPSANSIWVNMVGGTAAANAAGSFEVVPGAYFAFFCTNAVSVIGTATQKVTAGER